MTQLCIVVFLAVTTYGSSYLKILLSVQLLVHIGTMGWVGVARTCIYYKIVRVLPGGHEQCAYALGILMTDILMKTWCSHAISGIENGKCKP